jgi:hypothetical protein
VGSWCCFRQLLMIIHPTVRKMAVRIKPPVTPAVMAMAPGDRLEDVSVIVLRGCIAFE